MMNDFLTYVAQNGMTQDEATLREASKLIAHAYKMKARQKAVAFYPGQMVSFRAKNGNIVHGIVTKVNAATIKVGTTNGGKWSVSPGLLTAH